MLGRAKTFNISLNISTMTFLLEHVRNQILPSYVSMPVSLLTHEPMTGNSQLAELCAFLKGQWHFYDLHVFFSYICAGGFECVCPGDCSLTDLHICPLCRTTRCSCLWKSVQWSATAAFCGTANVARTSTGLTSSWGEKWDTRAPLLHRTRSDTTMLNRAARHRRPLVMMTAAKEREKTGHREGRRESKIRIESKPSGGAE